MGIDLFDQYSLLHFAVGVMFYFWGFSFWKWTVIHSIFEMIENTEYGMSIINNFELLKWWPGGKNQPDKIINSIGDVLFGSLGWLCAKFLDDSFSSFNNMFD